MNLIHIKPWPIEKPHVNATEPASTAKVSKQKKAPARERLSNPVLLELWAIWRTNPRVPSIKSRRAWAISRNAAPRLVDNWFLRRGRAARKAGEAILEGPYELSLESRIMPESPRPKRERCSPVPFYVLSSDDTLVYPDGDELDLTEASSDTVWDDFAVADTKVIKKRAYTDILPREDCKIPQQRCGRIPPPPFSDTLGPSSRGDHILEDGPGEDGPTLVSDDPLLPVCSQGRGKKSDGFTCILCSKKPLKGIRKRILRDLAAMPCSTEDSHTTTPQYLRLEVPPDTLMELSAIPYLFRTPTFVAPEIPGDRSTDNWMVLEDELGQLVKEGKLDFSFLDVPDLTSMELLD